MMKHTYYDRYYDHWDVQRYPPIDRQSHWFDNTHPYPMICDGIFYRSVENLYQAQKTQDRALREQIGSMDPLKVVKWVHLNVKPPISWASDRWKAMEMALRQKWSDNEMIVLMRDNLRADGKRIDIPPSLIAWNKHNDKIWGVSLYDNHGCNALGIMMEHLYKEYALHIQPS